MSEEQLKAFVSKIEGDSGFKEKLKAVETPEEVVDIAKAHGFDFDADKITNLTAKDLESLGGGANNTCSNGGITCAGKVTTDWACSIVAIGGC